jgi:hypothetical protein
VKRLILHARAAADIEQLDVAEAEREAPVDAPDQPSRNGFGRSTSALTGFARAVVGVRTTPSATSSTRCRRVNERRSPSTLPSTRDVFDQCNVMTS